MAGEAISCGAARKSYLVAREKLPGTRSRCTVLALCSDASRVTLAGVLGLCLRAPVRAKVILFKRILNSHGLYCMEFDHSGYAHASVHWESLPNGNVNAPCCEVMSGHSPSGRPTYSLQPPFSIRATVSDMIPNSEAYLDHNIYHYKRDQIL